MKPITIIAICAICAATLMSGCLDYTESSPEKDGGWGIADDVEYVVTPRPNVAHAPRIPAETLEQYPVSPNSIASPPHRDIER